MQPRAIQLPRSLDILCHKTHGWRSSVTALFEWVKFIFCTLKLEAKCFTMKLFLLWLLYTVVNSGCMAHHNIYRAGEIWKRRFHSENASNVFRPSYSNYRSFWICVSNKLMQGNHIIIVRSSFSKSSVFKIFSVHTKRKADAFKFFLFEERFQKLDFLDG